MLKKGLLVLLTVILPVMGMTAQDVIPVRTSPVQAMDPVVIPPYLSVGTAVDLDNGAFFSNAVTLFFRV